MRAKPRTLEGVFTGIYRSNGWHDAESVSGPGSTLNYTERLRSELPKLIRDFEIRSVFDAPCGDLNWMRHVLKEVNVDYLGADIVGDLVGRNIANFPGRRFVRLDLTKPQLYPAADLMICRDCLMHLSTDDVFAVLNNFRASPIRYLLVSSSLNHGGSANSEKLSGKVSRPLDLFEFPFLAPHASVRRRFVDWKPEYKRGEREMVLMERW